jgi:hypothetical protein
MFCLGIENARRNLPMRVAQQSSMQAPKIEKPSFFSYMSINYKEKE